MRPLSFPCGQGWQCALRGLPAPPYGPDKPREGSEICTPSKTVITLPLLICDPVENPVGIGVVCVRASESLAGPAESAPARSLAHRAHDRPVSHAEGGGSGAQGAPPHRPASR